MRFGTEALAVATIGGFSAAFVKEVFPDANIAYPFLAVFLIWAMALGFGIMVALSDHEPFSISKFAKAWIRMLAYLAMPLLVGLLGVVFNDLKSLVVVMQWASLGGAAAIEALSLLKQFSLLGVRIPPGLREMLEGKLKDAGEEKPVFKSEEKSL